MPAAFRNSRAPKACDRPAASAASSLGRPCATAAQNSRSCSRGYLPVVPGAYNLFFQLVNARYERGAMILTSNHGFAE